MQDLIIIGAGPAGITASVYASRKKMSLLVITKDIGGQAAWSGDIENYTGYQFITGPQLTDKFQEHMRKYDIPLKENETVTGVKKHNSIISVITDKGKYASRTVIVASGKQARELNVPGEKEFKNKGLTYCATCDGPIFSAKDVAVIGGGNSALDAAIQLLKIARHIYIINNGPELTADAVMLEQLKNDKVTVFNNTAVVAVEGERMVAGIRIKRQAKEEVLSVQGVFVEIGLIPHAQFIRDVEKNNLGEIKINCRNETNIAGIFAAGDVTDVPEKQVIVAAGEGAKAALSAFRYLVQHRFFAEPNRIMPA